MWMRDYKIYPDIGYAIRIGIKKWFKDNSFSWFKPSIMFTNDYKVNQRIRSRIALGWYNLLCGFVSR